MLNQHVLKTLTHLTSSFALLYSAEPFLIATNPFTPSSFLAFWTASIQALRGLLANFFFAAALAFLLTTLPLLLITRSDFVRPPIVFSFPPLKTLLLARLPVAILLTVFFFMAFMAFMAFIAFMAFTAFMAFIANAMAGT